MRFQACWESPPKRLPFTGATSGENSGYENHVKIFELTSFPFLDIRFEVRDIAANLFGLLAGWVAIAVIVKFSGLRTAVRR